MTDREAMKLAQEVCPYTSEELRGAFYEGFIKALNHVPDTTKMTEPEELVCVCGAIWQGQEMICPPRCLEEGIERERPTDRGAWDDVPDATKWVDELRGDEEPPNSTTDVVEPEKPELWFNGKAMYSAPPKQPEQEPVAWIDEFGNVFPLGAQRGPKYLNEPMKPLYTAPPKRKWQGLTDEEIGEVGIGHVEGEHMLPYSFARAIEAKLKEKNRD